MSARLSRHAIAFGLVAPLVVSCSGPTPDVVIESVDHTIHECPSGTSKDSDCLTVTASVVGDGTGSGRCVLYAAGTGENLDQVAESGELELHAGDTATWEIVVRRPNDPDFREWNPVCEPMLEG